MDHNSTPPLELQATLATGKRVPLFEAATVLLELENLFLKPAAKSSLVALRKAAMRDTTVDAELARPLVDAGVVLPPDNRVDPIAREVVLAAVRGEWDNLYLVSPYTNPLDRALSELVVSFSKVQSILSPEQSQEWLKLLTPDDGLGPWTRKMKNGGGMNPGSGLPSQN